MSRIAMQRVQLIVAAYLVAVAIGLVVAATRGAMPAAAAAVAVVGALVMAAIVAPWGQRRAR